MHTVPPHTEADLLAGWGRSLEEHRVRLGKTRPALAAEVGVHASTIWRIEHGRFDPAYALKLALSVALSVPMAELWAWPSVAA